MPEQFAPEVYRNRAVLNFEVPDKPADLALPFQFAIDEHPQCPTAFEAKTRPLHFDVASIALRPPITGKVHRRTLYGKVLTLVVRNTVLSFFGNSGSRNSKAV